MKYTPTDTDAARLERVKIDVAEMRAERMRQEAIRAGQSHALRMARGYAALSGPRVRYVRGFGAWVWLVFGIACAVTLAAGIALALLL